MKLENNMTSEVLKFTNNNMMIIENKMRWNENIKEIAKRMKIEKEEFLERLSSLLCSSSLLLFHSSGYNNLQGFCL